MSYGILSTNLNILKCTVESLDIFKDGASIFLSVVTGVNIIRGFNYLKDLKKKTDTATFTFLAQLRIRLVELAQWIENEKGVLGNFYTPDTRDTWESYLPPEDTRVEEFKTKVEDTITYIKSTPDQMPAYKGWTTDYNNLINFLNDVVQYDICDPQKYFKFTAMEQESQMEEYCEEIRKSINNLCSGIEKKQKEIEAKLFEK